jgi:hypothetical protein
MLRFLDDRIRLERSSEHFGRVGALPGRSSGAAETVQPLDDGNAAPPQSDSRNDSEGIRFAERRGDPGICGR